ncbi:MAG: inositol monophosphatase family protein [Ilumatobacteraceae bacterium]
MNEPVPSNHDLRAICERLALGGGRIAREGRERMSATGRFDRSTKSTVTDLVTEYDRAAEAHIVDQLRLIRPDDGILGEEGTADSGSTGLTWIIDPIDGTTNFVYDQPAWSCSVAVDHDGVTLAGAVAVPPLDELYSAALGAGATRNGEPIRASQCTDLGLALAGTGFSYDRERRRHQAAIIAALIGDVRDIRRLGSAAVDLCMVACGRLDLYFERHLNAWDIAAGLLIAREAGAVASDYSGGVAAPAELLVAGPALHQRASETLSAISSTPDAPGTVSG